MDKLSSPEIKRREKIIVEYIRTISRVIRIVLMWEQGLNYRRG
jgi:hypothetical protein